VQARDDVAIDLDHMQVIEHTGERRGERPQPGTDFHHGVVRLRPDRGDDVGDHRWSVRKCWPNRLRGCASPKPGRNPGRMHHLQRHFNRRKQAARVGRARAGQLQRRAMIDRGAHNGSPR
jgi:hypothetical protein